MALSPDVSIVTSSLLSLALLSCSVVAGLEDHERYRGFSDSRSTLCSDGSKIVECNAVPAEYQGQDGHYAGRGPELVSRGGAVTDTSTGLAWSLTIGKEKNFGQAEDFCAGLEGDYRLPSRLEIFTLLEYDGKGETLLDEGVFPTVEPVFHWTDTKYVLLSGDERWVVDLCTGCGDSSKLHGEYPGNEHDVLCVSGARYTPGPFEASGEGTVKDATTGLEWFVEPIDRSGFTWQEALEHCEIASLSGKKDWRLPNIKELQTIVDDQRIGPVSLFEAFLEDEQALEIWSSTPGPSGDRFYQIWTTGGSTHRSNLTYLSALCVRGPD